MPCVLNVFSSRKNPFQTRFKNSKHKISYPKMSINVGVIGTGNIGQDHIRRITHALSGARVVALTDIDLAGAQRIARDLDGRAESTRAKRHRSKGCRCRHRDLYRFDP